MFVEDESQAENGDEMSSRIKEFNKLTKQQKKISILAVIVLVVSFIVYANEKYVEYGKDFDLMTFAFGSYECKWISKGKKEEFMNMIRSTVKRSALISG